MSRGLWLGLLLTATVACALRWPQIDIRPMHCDEAVHAVKFGGLWAQGSYRYDPNEYHGPTLYYATLPLVVTCGERNFEELSERTLRRVPLLFGVGLILLLLLLYDALGPGGVLCAGALTAVSPAFVFYSRYYIHEMILVVLTLGLIGGGWRYWQTGKVGWAILSGASLGLMHATKETFVINLAALTAAGGAGWVWNQWFLKKPVPLKFLLNRNHLFLALGSALVVSVLLFSSFLTNLSGPIDSIRTYLPWLNRAGGHSPHIHPWNFYFERLFYFHRSSGPVWTEGMILALALVGGGAAFFRGALLGLQAGFVRFLTFYTLALTAAYTIISYKTPWCALGFLHGMILLAGVGAIVVLRLLPQLRARVAFAAFLSLGASHLAWQAWQASHTFCEDPRNPYVYAQTVSDAIDLASTVESLATRNPKRMQMPVAVAAAGSDYWPLPWYLRKLTQVGWYSQLSTNQPADVLIVSPKFKSQVAQLYGQTYQPVGLFGLRPTANLQLFVRADRWREYQARTQPSANNAL